MSVAAIGKKTVWFEVSKCTVPGCKTVRNFDKGRGKKNSVADVSTFKRYLDSPILAKFEKKFGTRVRAGFYNDEEQVSRPRSPHGLASGPEIQGSNSKGRK